MHAEQYIEWLFCLAVISIACFGSTAQRVGRNDSQRYSIRSRGVARSCIAGELTVND